jgi:glycyl-tRNA synthetase
MTQLRIPLDDIADVVRNLSYSKASWEEISAKYPKFEQQEASK